MAHLVGKVFVAALLGTSLERVSLADTQPVPPYLQGYWVREPIVHEPANQAVFAELGGPALLYSLNYEYRFIPELGARAGLTVLPACIFRCQTYVGIPLTMSAFVGSESHHLEMGAGITAFLIEDKDSRFLEAHIGYRYEPVYGGFVFRAMFTPIFRMNKPKDWLPWGGLSGGYSW